MFQQGHVGVPLWLLQRHFGDIWSFYSFAIFYVRNFFRYKNNLTAQVSLQNISTGEGAMDPEPTSATGRLNIVKMLRFIFLLFHLCPLGITLDLEMLASFLESQTKVGF
ncbi:hypothetical protein CHARACLAT_020970 [Characodon lateralis]|uniref:Uncharacterized protein n=1 Tax=Characodon lateralis TaxID=208331 RepID=A0ABU7DMA6_9TELE|nr:hypothetical protein [Characodon lateralis]